jgi:hypothetical protein
VVQQVALVDGPALDAFALEQDRSSHKPTATTPRPLACSCWKRPKTSAESASSACALGLPVLGA